MKNILKLIALTVLTFAISTSLKAGGGSPTVVSTTNGTPIVTITTTPVDVVATNAYGYTIDDKYVNTTTTTIYWRLET